MPTHVQSNTKRKWQFAKNLVRMSDIVPTSTGAWLIAGAGRQPLMCTLSGLKYTTSNQFLGQCIQVGTASSLVYFLCEALYNFSITDNNLLFVTEGQWMKSPENLKILSGFGTMPLYELKTAFCMGWEYLLLKKNIPPFNSSKAFGQWQSHGLIKFVLIVFLLFSFLLRTPMNMFYIILFPCSVHRPLS